MIDRLGTLFDGRDLVIVLALGLLATGLAMIYPPLALIVPGGLLFLLATWPLFAAGKGG